MKSNESVNLAKWAIPYDRNKMNPSDTYWLLPGKYVKMDYIDDRMTWRYLDSVQEPDMAHVAAALIWEEPRDIQKVILHFPAEGYKPDPSQIRICAKHSHTLWEDCRRWKFDTAPVYFTQESEVTGPDGSLVLTYQSPIDQLCKLYILYSGQETVCPEIEAYGSAVWAGSLSLDLEWLLDTKSPGELRVQNGEILSVEPLAGLSEFSGTGFVCNPGRNAVRLKIRCTQAPQNSRTQLTLWTDQVKTTFYPDQLEEGPIYIPAAHVYICKTGGPALEEFQQSLHTKTVREALKTLPEADLETSVRVNFGDKPLRMFPVPPMEPGMKINVPDQLIMGQWRIAAWHLLRHCWRMPDGTLCASIWPFDKGAAPRRDGNEGAAAIAGESERILQVLDLLGCHDEARNAISYWLDGERALPFFRFSEVMGRDTLANPYNSFNHCSPGYDQKHTAGHGQILRCIAHHYRITRDDAWLDQHLDRIIGACRAVARLRNEMKQHIGPDSWVYGLLPPSSSGDFGETRINYQVNGVYCAGLQEIGAILKEKGIPEAVEILSEAEDFARSIRRAAELSVAYCPVIRVADGTYRRYLTWQPYSRGMCAELDWSVNPRYFESVLNGITLCPDIFDPTDRIIDETLDVLEDCLYQQAHADTSKSIHGNHVQAGGTPKLRVEELSPEEEDLLYRGGYGLQCGIENHKKVYLLRGETAPFLRALFNSYAVEIDPDRAYIFWEGPNCGGAADKTFEEAAFIDHIRRMLIHERNGALWLCSATPRKWLEDGQTLSVDNAPTYYGTVSFKVTSQINQGIILASLQLPPHTPSVSLRLRIPREIPIKSVEVSGAKARHHGDMVELTSCRKEVTMTVHYTEDRSEGAV